MGLFPAPTLVDLPFQTDENCREDYLATYAGRKLRLKIIECVQEENRLIFSERRRMRGRAANARNSLIRSRSDNI